MSATTDPVKFGLVAKIAFAPVYPYLADVIKNRFGITEGVAVDAGAGPGYLAIALARLTNLRLYTLDIQSEMTELSRANIAEAGLSQRIEAVTADVSRMPFEDSSVDLVVSRGSLFFWDDRPAAFREVWRILKPGGAAFIGGSMGNEQIRAQVMETMATHPLLKDQNEDWRQMVGKIGRKLSPEALMEELKAAGVPGRAARDEGGLWVEIIKGKTP
jgi:ubiquinone/menaquinone biosynthesis C-methylase UbiE